MTSAKRVGRIIGMLTLVQGVAGYVVNFVLLQPVFRAPGGYLANAAGSSRQVALAVLLGLASGAITLGIAIAAFPILRRRGERLAVWLVALAVVGCSTLAVEQVAVRTMLSVSQQYASAGAADDASFRALGAVVAAARNWAHYTNLLVGGGTLLVLYAALYRFALVPRALAGFGLAAVLLQMFAVAMPLVGPRIVFPLLAPLGLSQLALALWLLVRGFDDGRRPADATPAREVRLAGA